MKALVFGSLNIDHVYQVDHFLRPGETIASNGYSRNAGGKGLNQAIALARAGQDTAFAGAIGSDGLFLRDALNDAGVDTQHLQVLDVPTGHAIIQVEASGDNAILLYGGANRSITPALAEKILSTLCLGDCVLLQNEISSGQEILRLAKEKGLRVAINPSPITAELHSWPLELADWLILNEVEGEDLTGCTEPSAMLAALHQRCPNTAILLTLGEAGAYYRDRDQQLYQPAVGVQPVDTTAAGDTFTGYFLAHCGEGVAHALRMAATAAAIAVTRPGAGASIPTLAEAEQFLNEQGH